MLDDVTRPQHSERENCSNVAKMVCGLVFRDIKTTSFEILCPDRKLQGMGWQQGASASWQWKSRKWEEGRTGFRIQTHE